MRTREEIRRAQGFRIRQLLPRWRTYTYVNELGEVTSRVRGIEWLGNRWEF